VSRNDSWKSANGFAGKPPSGFSIVAVGEDQDTGETPMLPWAGYVGGVEAERKVSQASRLCRGMIAGNLRMVLRARSAF
jgi:hypothetical protein